jgi:Ribbon-helix-helix protein, copG family
MVRTQIQLTDEQARKLRRRARQEGVSLAEIIRRYVDNGLNSPTVERSDLYRRASALIGKFPDTGNARDLAAQHDRYLEDAFQ